MEKLFNLIAIEYLNNIIGTTEEDAWSAKEKLVNPTSAQKVMGKLGGLLNIKNNKNKANVQKSVSLIFLKRRFA